MTMRLIAPLVFVFVAMVSNAPAVGAGTHPAGNFNPSSVLDLTQVEVRP